MVARFDAVRLFIFVLILWTLAPHFTLWLSARTLQCLFVWGRVRVTTQCVLYLALIRVGLSVLLWLQCCTKCYGLGIANN